MQLFRQQFAENERAMHQQNLDEAKARVKQFNEEVEKFSGDLDDAIENIPGAGALFGAAIGDAFVNLVNTVPDMLMMSNPAVIIGGLAGRGTAQVLLVFRRFRPMI